MSCAYFVFFYLDYFRFEKYIELKLDEDEYDLFAKFWIISSLQSKI